MAARNITELASRLIRACSILSELTEIQVKGEVRDYLAHEVARYCKKQNSMECYELITNFVNFVLEDK